MQRNALPSSSHSETPPAPSSSPTTQAAPLTPSAHAAVPTSPSESTAPSDYDARLPPAHASLRSKSGDWLWVRHARTSICSPRLRSRRRSRGNYLSSRAAFRAARRVVRRASRRGCSRGFAVLWLARRGSRRLLRGTSLCGRSRRGRERCRGLVRGGGRAEVGR